MENIDLTNTLTTLAASHSWILTAVAIIGAFRIVFKPLVGLVEAFVKATPSDADDKWVEAAEASKAYKFICWLIDLLASVKVGTQKK